MLLRGGGRLGWEWGRGLGNKKTDEIEREL